MNKQGTRAIVIGGGIAGLLAARVLIDAFDSVMLIERDRYPADPIFRAGTPQGHHVHNMLLRGQQILEELFPTFTAKILTQGAVKGNLLHDIAARYPAGWIPHPDVPPQVLDGYFCSRLLLEWQIRQEVSKYDQVQFHEGQEVIGLIGSDDKRSVRGVRVRTRQTDIPPDAHKETEILADLIVDASGRDSQVSRWLDILGYPRPIETTVKAYLGYATRIYTPANTRQDFSGFIVTSDPPKQLRSGVIWPAENGRWWVVLAGSGKDYPPTNEEEFLTFAKTLNSPRIYEAIKEAQPESPIYGYRKTENCLREFTSLPERLVIIGDAICALNPVYGQGMTVAAEGAILLRDMLRREKQPGLAGFTRRFYKAQEKMLRGAWQLASASDYRVPGVEVTGPGGEGKRGSNLVRSYLSEISYLMVSDPVVCLRFLEVINMLKAPTSLFHPDIASRVAIHRFRRRFSR